MVEQNRSRLNLLEKELPEGLLVDSAWLNAKGFASNLRTYYTKNGWLDQPARGVYRRTRGTLGWQQVVISLQTLLALPLIVGGRTALDLQGFAHYLAQELQTVHLYGPAKPPSWLAKLNLPQSFIYHNSRALFRNEPIAVGLTSVAWDIARSEGRDLARLQGGDVATLAWGQWDWPLTVSTPERAYLEMLDELPARETFHQADMIMQGAANFSPRRMQKLLADCTSVKVKRLFFFFADRHQHAWRKRLDKASVDLGTGKRMLVRGGHLDPIYLITVPEGLDANQ